MAKANQQQIDVEFKGMPGADALSKEEADPFQVDLNFDVPETPDTPDADVEFPVQEEAVEEAPEVAAVAEEEATSETEAPEEIEVEAADEAVEEVVEEAVEEIAEVQEPEPPKAPMVPKSRLDEVLVKNKQMRKQLDDIQQKEAEVQAEAPVYDFDIKEQEYQQLILDGATESATKVRSEMRQAEKDQLMFEVQQKMGQTVQQDKAEQELQEKAVEIAETFAIFNEESPEFNEELTIEVTSLRDAFIIQGYAPADSLARAAEYTLAAKHPELLQGAPEEAAVKAQHSKGTAEKRQKTTVRKKLVASKSQPPTMKGEGAAARGETAVNIDVLSDDEFSALPEDTLRRLRGDFG